MLGVSYFVVTVMTAALQSSQLSEMEAEQHCCLGEAREASGYSSLSPFCHHSLASELLHCSQIALSVWAVFSLYVKQR